MKKKLKRISNWIAKRSIFIFAVLLIGFVITLIWFVIGGANPDNENTIIGIAAVSALLSAISAIATLMQAVEAQKQRESLERPYVIAYFDSEYSGALNFVIKNTGNSPAIDISLEFSPSPIDFKGRPIDQISLFSNPISFLPEGKDIRQVIDSSYNFFQESKPLQFKIKISYYSIYGTLFTEHISHDLEYLKQTTLPRKTTDYYLQDIAKELKNLTELIKKMHGYDSLLVESPEEHSSRMESLMNPQKDKGGWRKIFTLIHNWIKSIFFDK